MWYSFWSTQAFDTVGHRWICRLANKLFESYIAGHKKFVSMKGFKSGITINVPQGSVLRLFAFLLYINDPI